MLHLISKYKTELMGFAIFWVVLFHSGITVPYLKEFTSLGYGGVDIFFFLSGYGLFFSSVKNESVLGFYKKRFIRVFPTYMIVVFIVMLGMGIFTWKTYLLNVSTVGYWINKSYFEWYVPALFAFYLCFPLIIKGFKHSPYVTILISFFVTAFLVSLKMHFHLHGMLSPFFIRIPIFMIGVLFGKYTYEKKQPVWINSISLYIIALLSLAGLIFVQTCHSEWLWYYGLYWYPFFGITPGLCLFVIFILEKINAAFLFKVLAFLGSLSLEIYLLHIKPFLKAADISAYFGVPKPLVLLLIIALVIPISYFLSKGIGWLVSFVEQKVVKQ